MIHRKTPLLLPLLSLITGIILADHFVMQEVFVPIASCCAVALFLLAMKYIPPFRIGVLFLFLGITIVAADHHLQKSYHFSSINGDALKITIESKKRTKKGWSYEAKVLAIEAENNTHNCRGKILIYTGSISELEVKHTYRFTDPFYEIEALTNPGIFDYGSFLSRKSIQHQLFVKNPPEMLRGPTGINVFLASISGYVDNHFKSSFKNTRSSSLLQTLILGKKSDLTAEEKKLFINNGLAHLLAISGMHVGIILLIFNFIVSPIKVGWIRKTIILLGIWLYILMSGLQTPAIRAGFMLTVFVIGQLGNRNIKNLNSVFFAAMAMLALDYNLLFQVSFQLSFSAMASIVIFFKPIYNLYVPQKRWVDKFWQLTALNLSVQIFVLPLTIFYFKQLPVYFMLTSLISIPFITMIMWGAIFSVLISSFLKISVLWNELLSIVIDIYLSLLSLMSKLPYSLVKGINIHYMQLIMWFVGILLLYHYLWGKRRNYSYACFSFVPLIVISSLLNIYENNRSEIMIYDEPKAAILDFKEDNQIIRFQLDTSYMSYILRDIPATKIVEVSLNEIYDFNGRSFTFLDDYEWMKSETVPLDICILISDVNQHNLQEKCRSVVVPRNTRITQHNYYSIAQHGAYKLSYRR